SVRQDSYAALVDDPLVDQEVSLRPTVDQNVGDEPDNQAVHGLEQPARRPGSRGPDLTREDVHPDRDTRRPSSQRGQQPGLRRNRVHDVEAAEAKEPVKLEEGTQILGDSNGSFDRNAIDRYVQAATLEELWIVRIDGQ